MEQSSRYCPNHMDLKVLPFQNECMICNKPLHTRMTSTEKPAPVVVEEVENTLHDPRINGLDFPPPEDKEMVKKRLAEEKEIVARRLYELTEKPKKITAETDPFKTFREKIEAKVFAKAEEKKTKSAASYGELAKANIKSNYLKKGKK